MALRPRYSRENNWGTLEKQVAKVKVEIILYIPKKMTRNSVYILKSLRAEIRRATIRTRLFAAFISRRAPASWFAIVTPGRSTIAVGLVSHRATTSGGRKGARRYHTS